jgi:hypothetical protein
MLTSKKFEGTVHFWRPGLAYWLPIRMDALAGSTPALFLRRELIAYEQRKDRRGTTTFSAKAKAMAQRRFPRQGLVATVFLVSAGGKRDYLGICLDVSARGLGVQLDQVCGFPEGAHVTIELVPLSLTGLQPFRVQGSVRWSSATEMGLELTDYAQAEQAVAVLDLQRLVEAVVPMAA